AHLEPLQRQLSVFCSRMLNRREDADDVLQSAVANAFRDFDKYSEGTSFRAWMYRYVTLEILNRNRTGSRSADSIDDHGLSHEPVPAIDSFRIEALLEAPEIVLDHCDDVVAICVRKLTELERKILLLRAVGDFKYREIADVLDIPIGTVMGLLSRARHQLRTGLLEYARENGLLRKGDAI
ncbi:MAG: RNA polymerase sigma factor, partial [Planctomycetota bacterium]|nr:RNA polymerase sigma factor [Planctomycetota bacterium]